MAAQLDELRRMPVRSDNHHFQSRVRKKQPLEQPGAIGYNRYIYSAVVEVEFKAISIVAIDKGHIRLGLHGRLDDVAQESWHVSYQNVSFLQRALSRHISSAHADSDAFGDACEWTGGYKSGSGEELGKVQAEAPSPVALC